MPSTSRRRSLIHGKWRWLAAIAGIFGIVAGAYLVKDYLDSIPPDAKNANIDQVIDFTMRDDFNRMPARQRHIFSQQLLNRFADMTDQQRALAQQRISEHRKQDKDHWQQQTITFWRDFLVNEAQQYLKVPPQQREAYLRNRMGMLRLLGGNATRHSQRAQPHSAVTRNQQARSHQFYVETVLPHTSAKDRALLVIMLQDLRKLNEQDAHADR